MTTKHRCPLDIMPITCGTFDPDRHTWISREGKDDARFCSHCGSLHPADAIRTLRNGGRAELRYNGCIAIFGHQFDGDMIHLGHFDATQRAYINSLDLRPPKPDMFGDAELPASFVKYLEGDSEPTEPGIYLVIDDGHDYPVRRAWNPDSPWYCKVKAFYPVALSQSRVPDTDLQKSTDQATTKPAPTFGPVYAACVYPEFAKIFKKHGYALAVHGSLARDFDVIAVPWADDASKPCEVVDHLLNDFSLDIVKSDPRRREHGRLVYSLAFMGEFCVDLSFMPRVCEDSVAELADNLATDLSDELFKIGDEPCKPCARIQFKSDKDDDLGGLCKDSLRRWLAENLRGMLQ